MSSLLPVAVYGLEVPPGDVLIPAAVDFPATIRISMAALDPTEEAEPDKDGNVPTKGRSTLRILKQRMGDVSDSDDEEDDYLQALLDGAGADSDDEDEGDEDEDDDEEPNGGPSDPSKSKKARQEAAIRKLIEATQNDDEEDEDMEDGDADAEKPNGVAKPGASKGKEPATSDDESDSDDDSDDGLDLENFVVCTLDTDRSYQQPLDITIGENEKAFFLVSGTHAVHLTGNYVIDPSADDEDDSDDDDEDDYDLSPDADELDDEISTDELDDIREMNRLQEIDTDDDEVKAPKLVDTKKAKGKKRPAADDDEEGLDEMMAKEVKVDQPVKLSKKQMKKLKNNKGEAVAVDEAKSAIKETSTPTKSDKKVQFAKNLEQGPTGSAEKGKPQQGSSLGTKVVQGITVDDRKLGSGRTAKSGDKVSLRYIGKLDNGKVFDANKKGTPFTFKVGKGEVIKGWDIGILGMSIGGERRLIIPPSMAYGSKKLDGIPANSTLTFDVKLLEIK